MSERPHKRLGPIGWLLEAFRADRLRVIVWAAVLLIFASVASNFHRIYLSFFSNGGVP